MGKTKWSGTLSNHDRSSGSSSKWNYSDSDLLKKNNPTQTNQSWPDIQRFLDRMAGRTSAISDTQSTSTIQNREFIELAPNPHLSPGNMGNGVQRIKSADADLAGQLLRDMDLLGEEDGGGNGSGSNMNFGGGSMDETGEGSKNGCKDDIISGISGSYDPTEAMGNHELDNLPPATHNDDILNIPYATATIKEWMDVADYIYKGLSASSATYENESSLSTSFHKNFTLTTALEVSLIFQKHEVEDANLARVVAEFIETELQKLCCRAKIGWADSWAGSLRVDSNTTNIGRDMGRNLSWSESPAACLMSEALGSPVRGPQGQRSNSGDGRNDRGKFPDRVRTGMLIDIRYCYITGS